MAFTREQLEEFRGETVPDLIGEDVKLLFVGINPGLWTAATQTHFCHPSNRFYPGLRRAGLIDWDVDTSVGITDEQRQDFVGRGMGITNLVSRATVRASELGAAELRAGGQRLVETVERVGPRVVAVAGVTAYRTAFGEPKATMGKQESWGRPGQLWVIPNPSGLNAHETIDSLAEWFGRVAAEAGLS